MNLESELNNLNISLTNDEWIILRVLSREDYYGADYLAELLNIPKRELRDSADHDGLISSLQNKLIHLGWFIIARMQKPSGYKLTNDIKEVEENIQHWERFFWHVKQGIDNQKKRIKMIHKDEQLEFKI